MWIRTQAGLLLNADWLSEIWLVEWSEYSELQAQIGTGERDDESSLILFKGTYDACKEQLSKLELALARDSKVIDIMTYETKPKE
jgi:hypothetical protein